MDTKKMANNILEFLIDPTGIPVKERIYFREEENLQNQSYEGAKAEAFKAYGTERFNSDMYPTRNRSMKKEGSVMDRKTIIASMDILSQAFKQENDPIAKDLRTMAYAISKMSDEEVASRLEIEAAAEKTTPPAPANPAEDDEAGVEARELNDWMKLMQKVRNDPKNKGKSVKELAGIAKGLYKKAVEEDEGALVEARELNDWMKLMQKVRNDPKNEGKSVKELAGIAKKLYKKSAEVEKSVEAGKVKGPGKPDGTGPFSGTPQCQMNKPEEEVVEAVCETWTKEASDSVARALVAEIKGIELPETKKPVEEVKEEKKEPPKEEVKEEKKEPETVKLVVKAEAKEVAPEKEPEKIVNTDMLKTSSVHEGIELRAGMISTDDIGELTKEEAAKLSLLFK